MATPDYTCKWMNFMRAVSSEGYGRIRFFRKVRQHLVRDREFRQYFEGESTQLPGFYRRIIEEELGKWLQWLPQGAIEHDPNVYLQKKMRKAIAV